LAGIRPLAAAAIFLRFRRRTARPSSR